mgnify:CR=1 FL=1
MVKNAIEFQHISFQYADGNTKVLKDVNFSIPFGSVTLLTGRTGVGKTTLLRILTRVIPEDVSGTIYGNILVDGEPKAFEIRHPTVNPMIYAGLKKTKMFNISEILKFSNP